MNIGVDMVQKVKHLVLTFLEKIWYDLLVYLIKSIFHISY